MTTRQSRIEILGDLEDRYDEILTPEALHFITRLHDTFAGRRHDRLAARMHERKAIMFEQSDAFAVLPGGIGTLEEVVELLSWRRLALHAKPIVFLNPGGYWTPLFDLFSHTVEQGLSPAWFLDAFRAVETAEELLPAMRAMLAPGAQTSPDPRAARDAASLT